MKNFRLVILTVFALGALISLTSCDKVSADSLNKMRDGKEQSAARAGNGE